MKEKVCVDCKYFKACGDSERTESCSGKETKILTGQLYEPEEGKYNLPIFINDNAVSAYTWQYIIDTYTANYGHKADDKKFRKHLREFLDMISEDVMETYDLCKTQIMKEVRE